MNTIYQFFLFLLFMGGVSSSQEVSYHERLKIKDTRGLEVFSVKFYQEKIKVEIPDKTLEAKVATKKGKRKYEHKDNDVAEVLYGEKGFKLRDTKGQLIWKVKFSDDQIRIASNEEMELSWIIDKSGEKLKVSNQGSLVAEVKWYADSGKLKLKTPVGKELFIAKTNGISSTIAILAIAEMSDIERAIIMTELEVLEK